MSSVRIPRAILSVCAFVMLTSFMLMSGGVSYSQTPAINPSITTSDAAAVTTTGADLHGSVNPMGKITAVWFEWGTGTPLPNHTEFLHVVAGTAAVTFVRSVSGLEPHTIYYFRAAAQSEGGAVVYGEPKSFTTLSTSTTSPGVSPTVSTGEATAIIATGASLHGTVNPGGKATTAWFDWGTSTPFTNHTDARNAGDGTVAVSYDQSIANLQPHTTYYFQAVAQNAGGTIVRGEGRTFTTTASTSTTTVTPSVSTGEVGALTATTAELRGTANPAGVATTAWFEWGTKTPLANTSDAHSLGSGTAAVSFSQSISGLQPNTTYYYVAVAQNAGATIRGSARSFTTAKVPSTPPEPITEVEGGSIKSGYVMITPDASSAAPTPTLTFATVGEGTVLSQAGLVPAPMTTDASMYVEVIPSIMRNIGVAITNPGSTINTVTLTLRDEDGMVVGTPATVSVPPHQQVARFIHELYSADAIGTGFSGSLRLQSSTAFAVLGLRFSGTIFSTVPIIGTATVPGVPTTTLTAGPAADTPMAGTVGGPNAILLPQFAMSGGWSTLIAIVNNTDATITGRLDVFDTTGTPMAVKLNGMTKSTFTYSIPEGGAFVLAPRDSKGQSPM